MKSVLVHLSGSKRGKTDCFTNANISVGTDASCNLRFDQKIDKGVSPLHAEIRFENGSYIIKDLDGPGVTLVNNKLIQEVTLNDGDLIEYAENGPRMRFRIKTEKSDAYKPFREMLADSMDLAREPNRGRRLTTAMAFFRSLIFEAYTQSSMYFKVISLFVFLIVIGGVGALGYTVYSTITEATKRLEVLEFESTVAEKIIRNYSGGICLIQGSYSLIDDKGEPLKAWSNGRLLTNDYTGTGFLVSKDGKVLTNRHIAEPWWNKKSFFSSIEHGLTPKFEEFRAFFPNIKKSFPLKVEKVSEDSDVALLSFDPEGMDIPILELDSGGADAVEGEPVVLLGYPAGLSALYAMADEKVAERIIQLPFLDAASELSDRNLIKPLTTQGHIGDVLDDRVIYDAQTTVGGSGGPLFNNKGKVIAINYGIFQGFRGANFGVPIKYALALLKDEKH